MTDPFNFPPLEDEASAPGIAFAYEDVDLSLPEPELIRWIERVIHRHGGELGAVQYIFCSDAYLHRLNVDYLNHDTLTDIITFPYADPPLVAGDIFISTDRVADNAQDLQQPFEQELRRVIIHGILHLRGFGDKTPEDAQRMRTLEEEALAVFDREPL